MTVIGFNYKRVILAAQRVRDKHNQAHQQQRTKPNIEALERILDSIIIAVGKQKARYQKYVSTALEQGMEPKEVFNLAKERLRDCVSIKTIYNWSHELLPQEAFDIKQSERRLGKKAVVNLQPLQEAISNHIECESCAEAYEIEKIRAGVYTYEYLQQVCIWLHDTLSLNCQNWGKG